MRPDVVRNIGLRKIPSKGTIWRAYGRIPEEYLHEIRRRIVRDIMEGSPAGDSTGYSSSRFVKWFSVRHGKAMAKHGWIKLHAITYIATRTIMDYHITDGYASDIASIWPMMERLGPL